jgi:hypothetical protein
MPGKWLFSPKYSHVEFVFCVFAGALLAAGMFWIGVVIALIGLILQNVWEMAEKRGV